MPRVVSFEELDAVLRSGGAADALRQFKGDMVPARFLRQLAAAAEPESDLFLSGWPDTPAKILEELAGRSAANSELAGALVRHSRTPAKILEELAGSGGRETRDLLARCPCESGCPACCLSARCGNNNEPMDKVGAVMLAREIAGVR